jgi:hypothetical protein
MTMEDRMKGAARTADLMGAFGLLDFVNDANSPVVDAVGAGAFRPLTALQFVVALKSVDQVERARGRRRTLITVI